MAGVENDDERVEAKRATNVGPELKTIYRRLLPRAGKRDGFIRRWRVLFTNDASKIVNCSLTVLRSHIETRDWVDIADTHENTPVERFFFYFYLNYSKAIKYYFASRNKIIF